jgi:hypothetical protein
MSNRRSRCKPCRCFPIALILILFVDESCFPQEFEADKQSLLRMLQDFERDSGGSRGVGKQQSLAAQPALPVAGAAMGRGDPSPTPATSNLPAHSSSASPVAAIAVDPVQDELTRGMQMVRMSQSIVREDRLLQFLAVVARFGTLVCEGGKEAFTLKQLERWIHAVTLSLFQAAGLWHSAY